MDPFTDVFAISGTFGTSRTTVKDMALTLNTPYSTQTLTLASAPRDLVVQDANGDGNDDILVATGVDVSFIRGLRDRELRRRVRFSPARRPTSRSGC